jgi:hypothetical protein
MEDLSIEEFVPQPHIKAFTVSVFPRTARFDISSFCPTAEIQSLTDFATNSGPLSDLMYSGNPLMMKRSVNTSRSLL